MAVQSKRSQSIGRTLTQSVGAVICAAFVLIVYFYAQQQHRNIRLQNERAMHQVVDTVNQGLKSVMITGSADVANVYAENLKHVESVEDFRILRVNGLEAFKDNETIDRVNRHRKGLYFEPRVAETPTAVLAADDPQLLKLLDTGQVVYYYHEAAGGNGTSLTFLMPIRNERKCARCHGDEAQVLGVVKLTSTMAGVERAVRETWLRAAGVLVVALIAVLVVTSLMLRRYIIEPIERVSAAMSKVAASDLTQTVPVLGRDELATMAADFNRLTAELKGSYDELAAERNKLQTIIMGTEEGIVVSDGAGRIVLVNPAAEALLGKPRSRIVDEGLPLLFDDPRRMARHLEAAAGPESRPRDEVLLHHSHFLSLLVSTIHAEDGHLLGHVALLRDVTKEKRLEQRLRELSNTDALTGLANRRALDETLAAEFALAAEQGRDLALLMFDVDHFKRFNDTYGHAQGDRVLIAFAATTLRCGRDVLDTVCRYGGEEFMVIARETSQQGGMVLAERIRAEIEAMVVDQLRVTTSIGVAGLRETGAVTPLALIECADAALYAAKRGGRNRVMMAEVGT